MIHVAPILLLALVRLARARARRGRPSSPPARRSAPAALLLALPLGQLLNISILSDTFALIPLLRVDQAGSGGVDDVR